MDVLRRLRLRTSEPVNPALGQAASRDSRIKVLVNSPARRARHQRVMPCHFALSLLQNLSPLVHKRVIALGV